MPRLALLCLALVCAASAAPSPKLPWWQPAAGAQGADGASAPDVLQAPAGALRGQAAAHLANKPYFCMGLDCPDFDVLETSGDMQLRRYRAARYIVTHVEAASLLAAQLEGTKRLLSYLAGDNEDRAKLLPPTVPLETILFPADERSETVEGRFCVALYLPECAQSDPPRPSDRRVRIVHTRTVDWFVLRIRTSLIDERAVIHRAWEFIRELRHERGRCAVNSRVVSFGVYDLPVPFIKPGYFEIAVPRRSRRDSCTEGGGDDPAPAPTPVPAPGGDPTGDDDDFGVDTCEVCGDCGGGGDLSDASPAFINTLSQAFKAALEAPFDA